MKKYIHYSTEEFVADAYFINWVLNPDEEANLFWEKFSGRYPQKKEIVDTARGFILDLQSVFEKENANQIHEGEGMHVFNRVREIVITKNKLK